MAQKTGALIFDETADRYDIRFDSPAFPVPFSDTSFAENVSLWYVTTVFDRNYYIIQV